MAFRILAVVATVVAFGQVTLGGVVRVSGSGLGCPDWPLCHGQLIPPLEVTTLIEYSHRVSASILGILTTIVAIMAYIQYRSQRWVLVPSMIAFGLVCLAAALGGVTVLTELAWWVVLFHLSIAEALIATLVVVVVACWQPVNFLADESRTRHRLTRLELLAVMSVGGVFALILSGSFMVGYGAGTSCATWPLCRGNIIPEGTAYAIHMGHRLLVILVGVLLVMFSMTAWNQRISSRTIAWCGVLLICGFGIQVILGAITVWASFSPETKAVHLSAGTLVWVALVFMTCLVYFPRLNPDKIDNPDPNPKG